MSKLPSMPFFPADFFADTRHLTGEQKGLYLLMLNHAWLSEGKLPSDEKTLLRMLGVHWRFWKANKEAVLPFWKAQERFIINSRAFQDWIRINSINEQNKINGARGGRPKSLFSHNVEKANGYHSVNRVETGRLTNQNQNQNHIIKDSFNGELRQESRWVPTKRIGSRLFKVGELAPAYDGQPPRNWKHLKPEDCQ